MKKFLASTVFIALFATYALYQHTTITATNTDAQASPVSQTVSVAATNNSQNTVPKIPTVAQATPVDKPKGLYADGMYTGSSENAFYGTVQVRATVSGGKLTDVTFLSYPNDRGTSRMINAQAMPQLKQEAISAQNANVDGVSGASDTSEAFRRSLSSALLSAKA